MTARLAGTVGPAVTVGLIGTAGLAATAGLIGTAGPAATVGLAETVGPAGTAGVGHRRPPGSRARGSATAELAVALPALILLLLFALGAIDAVLARMQCLDAARDAALVAARGGDGLAAGRARAPQGALVSVGGDAATVRVSIRLDVHPLGAHLPGVTVAATAVADREPDQGALEAGP